MTPRPPEADSDRVPTLPDDAVLVHIGPYKTGTTALQASLGKHRDDLAEHGVLYPGPRRNHHEATWALRGSGTTGRGKVPPARWTELRDAVTAHPGRCVISSEFLVGCDTDTIARLVDDLGPERVHVVLTVRTLAPLLSSDWQEKVKTHRFTDPYDVWLSEVLAPEQDSRSAQRFWRFYGVRQILDAWGSAVPHDRIVVLVSDGTRRDQAPRTFETLLGLPTGLLTPAHSSTDNASLTADRVELLRRLNEVFDSRGWSDPDLRRLVHQGLLKGLARPVDGDPGTRLPALPGWAHERVAELSEQRAAELLDSGAVVLGDPRRLAFEPPAQSSAQSDGVPVTIGLEAALNGIEALVEASLTQQQKLTTQVGRLKAARKKAAAEGSTTGSTSGGRARRLRNLIGRLRG